MSYKYFCKHLNSTTNIPLTNLKKYTEENTCADCDYSGPKLWICLHQNCLRLGCSDQLNDHSTSHYTIYPAHCIHMNLASGRIWCYKCNTEVFMEVVPDSNDNNQQQNDDNTKNLNENINDHTNVVKGGVGGNPIPVGLNVQAGGDSTDYSDSDDSDDLGLDKPAGLVGLQNIGNTCYMNAALQALSNAPPLTKFFLDCSSVVQLLSEGRKPGLSRTYQSLMQEIWVKKKGGYVSAAGILYGIRNVHPMFRGYHQHDTQEFLRNFMDQLHEELKQQCTIDNNLEYDKSSSTIDEAAVSSSYDSSEGEYETCDSGVSERSSLSDDTDRSSNKIKRRLSRSTSPGRRLKARIHNSGIIDCQPSTSSSKATPVNKQIKYRSIISDIFDGKLLSSVQCLTCNRISSRVETFQDLSLPIPSRDHLVVLHGRGTQPGTTCSEAVIPVQDGWVSWIYNWLKSWFYGPTVTLHDCLAAFFSTDELKGDNMYSCEKCNKLRNGIKFSKVLQLPEVLCIHLKRFRHELMFSSKISAAVSFPLEGLEMKPYLHKDCVSKVTNYELFSVICHHGTAGGGHYISYALNNGQWYEFDDQCVTKVFPDKVENCEAYVLFYRKSLTQANELKSKAIKMSELCDDFDKEIAYVSKQWINRFNTCAEPGPIDNSDFLCQHGSMNPDKIVILNQLSVVIPLTVYEYLHKLYGGCPPITCIDICPPCQAFNKRLLLEMEKFVELTTEAQTQDTSLTHLLSISWYNQWHNFINKKTQELPGPIDNTKININQIDSNESVEIPEDIWIFFYNIYGGGPEIRLKQEEKTPDVSDNENNIEEKEIIEDEIEFVIPNLKKRENEISIDKNNYCHGEPMELSECSSGKDDDINEDESDKECNQHSIDIPKCCYNNKNDDLSVCNNSNLYSSIDCSEDNAGYNNLNNNINNETNRRNLKIWLDSN